MFRRGLPAYAKYKPDKLMEHIKLFHKRINAHKLIRTCEQFHHWAEARFLYRHNDEFDNAIKVMMRHTAEAWEHEIFKDILTKVKGTELCYQAIHFYIQISPSRSGAPDWYGLVGSILHGVQWNDMLSSQRKNPGPTLAP